MFISFTIILEFNQATILACSGSIFSNTLALTLATGVYPRPA